MRRLGLEPRTHGLKGRCSTKLSYRPGSRSTCLFPSQWWHPSPFGRKRACSRLFPVRRMSFTASFGLHWVSRIGADPAFASSKVVSEAYFRGRRLAAGALGETYMLTLLLLRHGKSDWDASFASDHERPLARRGRRAASLVGQFLSALELTPDSVITSSAVRAKTTVKIAVDAGEWDCGVRVTDSFYRAAPRQALQEVQAETDSTKTLLIAGHEPTWSALVTLLIGGGSLRFPTAALACIEFPVEHWKMVEPARGHLAWLVTPRQLRPSGWRK